MSASVTALFWGVWYLIAGSVPVVTGVRFTEKEVLTLPFGISRWCDILCAPIWTSLIIVLCSMPWKKWFDDDDLAAGLVFGLAFGLAYGLVISISGICAGLLGAAFRSICTMDFWKKVGSFLTAQDKEV